MLAITAAHPAAEQWAARAAALTRRAFAAAEEVSGLPTADGASDDAALLLAELDAGAVLWLAVDGDRLLGAMRVAEHGDGWEVRRVAVQPRNRHGGVAAALIDAVEHAAGQTGRRVWLNAVVERCLPPVYARLGYQVSGLEPGPGKPLSELVMWRDPTRPKRPLPLAQGWTWPAVLPTITWLLDTGGVLAVAGRHRDIRAAVTAAAGTVDPERCGPARLAGVDIALAPDSWDFTALVRRLGATATPLAPGIVRFPARRADVPGHVMPRTVAPDLFAVWRFSPGREPAVAASAVRPLEEKIS
jgi:GNAT superfamily N-acetyltransferase